MPSALAEKTLDRLLELVIKNKAGTVIPPQSELAVQFDVSRTVLREALVVLEHLGILSIRPKTGTSINDPAKWKVVNSDVIDWRVQTTGETQAHVLDSALPLEREGTI